MFLISCMCCGHFTKAGEFDYLLNATENLDLLSQRFIVFELDNIKDHPILFPVVTIILMDVFIAKMRRLEGIRKVLLLEEVWKALARTSMEEAIQYWVKTIRKYFGELWLVITRDRGYDLVSDREELDHQ
jgi:type IV secretory pathway VirB4 component